MVWWCMVCCRLHPSMVRAPETLDGGRVAPGNTRKISQLKVRSGQRRILGGYLASQCDPSSTLCLPVKSDRKRKVTVTGATTAV